MVDWYDEDSYNEDWLEEMLGSPEVPSVSPGRRGRGQTVPNKEKASSNTLVSNAVHPLHTVFPKDTKMGKAISWWSAGVYTYNTGKKAHNWLKTKVEKARQERFSITIDSYEEEDLYLLAVDWIMSHIDDPEEINEFSLVTKYKRPKNVVSRISNTDLETRLDLEGFEVHVNLNETEYKDGNFTSLKKVLMIRCKDQESLDTITNKISEIYDSHMYDVQKDEIDSGRRPRPYAYWNGMSWGWKEMLPRDADSVVLKNDDMSILLSDISNFLSLKSEYLRTNIPWHRGYLFHGPPGTGKTSLGMAVASLYDLPTYVLPLSSVPDDPSLVKAIAAMEVKEAVLILEDIDVVSATHSRSSGVARPEKSVTLAGLLNVLDGINSPSGLITVMTTNHLTTLDPALIRPGRVDRMMEVGYLDDDQLQRMLLWYLGREEYSLPPIESNITPAQITGIVKDYLGEPDRCVEEISKFINDSNNEVRSI